MPTTWAQAVAFGGLLDTETFTEDSFSTGTLPVQDIPLEATQADSYRYVKRLHRSGGTPYCYSEIYVEEGLYKEHAKAFKSRPSAAVLAGIPHLELSAVRQRISIIEADFQCARALEIEVGAPVAEVRRFVISSAGTLIQYARFEFPTNFVNLEFDLLNQ